MFIQKSDNHGRAYLSLAEKVKDGQGHWKKHILMGIGYVDQLETCFKDPQDFFKKFLKTVQSQTDTCLKKKEPIPFKDEQSVIQLGSLYISAILDEFGLDKLFEEIQSTLSISYNLYEIFKLLVIKQIIDPTSVEKSIEEDFRFTAESGIPLYDAYRALNYIAQHCDQIQTTVFEHLGLSNDELKDLYFDGSNIYFHSDFEDKPILSEDGEIICNGLKTKGFSKENRPLPLLNFAILADSEGMPIASIIFPGKEHEKSHLGGFINWVRDTYHLKNFQLVADRGNYSNNIMAAIAAADKKLGYKAEYYLLGAPIRSASKETREWATSPKGIQYYLLKPEPGKQGYLPYKYRIVEKPLEFFNIEGKREKVNTKQAQFSYYSFKYAQRERHKREKKWKEAGTMVKHPSLYNAKKKAGAAFYVQEDHLVKNTGVRATQQQLKRDKQKKKKQEALDGYYLIVTNNLKIFPMHIKPCYGHLRFVEDDFKYLKSYLKIRPAYLRTPAHLLAYVLINIIALQVVLTMKEKLNNLYSFPQIIKALREFVCFNLEDQDYFIPFTNPIIEALRKDMKIGFKSRNVTLKEIREQFRRK